MISLPNVDGAPFVAPSILLGILAFALLSGAILVALEMRAESSDR